MEPPDLLVLGGLHDVGRQRQLPFGAARPRRYWHVTWAFVLEPLDSRSTRLSVRARVAFSPDQRWHAAWIRPVHHLMQRAQLRNVARRAEGRVPRDDWRDVIQGLIGASRMAAGLLTPFLRSRRARWGVDPECPARALPGDELVVNPRSSWSHGIEIEAPAWMVWQWVAQNRCRPRRVLQLSMARERRGLQPAKRGDGASQWELREGQALVIHPNVPPLRVVAVDRGRYFVAHAPADARALADGRPWVAASWLFLVEPLGPNRCRFISRYRASCSSDLATRLSFGPAVVDPIGFEMDRRMLLGVKQRAEAWREVVLNV